MFAVVCCGFNCGYCRSLCMLLLHVQAVLLLLCVFASYIPQRCAENHPLPTKV
jgi:hypothetical protein